MRRPEQSEVFLGSMIALASANTSSVSISLHIATAKNSVSVQYCPNVPSLTTMSLRSITHPALYGWLEPTYGVFPALSIVGGVLAVLALVLIKAAMILSSGRPGNEKGTATPNTIEVPPSPVPLSVTPAPVDSVVSPASAPSAATGGDMIEPFLSVVKCYTHIRSTGSAPVDDFIRQMELRVEVATKEAVTRAATLVQTGDRATVLAVLGAAMAFGWLLVKTANSSVVSNR